MIPQSLCLCLCQCLCLLQVPATVDDREGSISLRPLPLSLARVGLRVVVGYGRRVCLDTGRRVCLNWIFSEDLLAVPRQVAAGQS